ncbi:MAG: hypothetical protein IKX40_01155 [Thermoguttaceae bacterium]|nr:hypothetical protein [Thermoguttaceae bacterium]
MKSLFFIVLGAIPLALLTILALLDMTLVRPWKPDVKADHFEKTVEVVERTSRELRSLDNASDILAKDSLLNSPVPPIMRGMSAENTAWGEMPDYSRQWGDVFFNTQRFLESQRHLESQDINELFKLQSDVRSFLATLKSGTETQDSVYRQISALQRDIEVKIERLQKENEATQILTEARNAFDQKKWLVCARFCKQLTDDYEDYTSVAVKANVSMMLNRCAFYTSEDEIERILQSDSAASQKQKLGSLLERVKNSDELSDAQKRKYRQWQEQYEEMGGNSDDADDSPAISSSVKSQIQAYYDAPKSFAGRVQAAAKILETNNDPAVRSALKSEVIRLIKSGIAEKTLNEPPMTFYAKLKDGTELTGGFITVRDDNRQIIGYKYFKDANQMTDSEGNELMYKAEDFIISPRSTMAKRLVNTYNKERKLLLDNVSDPDAWSRFIAKCNELEMHRKTENVSGVSFAGAIKAAEQISAPEIRPQLEEVLK